MYILDINVVSELRKIHAGKADEHVSAWTQSVNLNDLYLSVITVQELEIGVCLIERRDSAQGKAFRAWFNQQVLPTFAGWILPIDTAVALRSAKLHVPNPQTIRDGLIVATALVHGMTVVTRNIADLQSTRVSLLNPWAF